jgi:hypothetical protein
MFLGDEKCRPFFLIYIQAISIELKRYEKLDIIAFHHLINNKQTTL